MDHNARGRAKMDCVPVYVKKDCVPFTSRGEQNGLRPRFTSKMDCARFTSPVLRPRRRSPRQPDRKPSALLDTRVISCGDCLEQFRSSRPPALTDLHRSAVQFQPQLRGHLGETRRSAPSRTATPHRRLHRLHAPALRRARPRPEENRQLLLPLRLAASHYVR